jgi:uncharacterized protein YlaI
VVATPAVTIRATIVAVKFMWTALRTLRFFTCKRCESRVAIEFDKTTETLQPRKYNSR